VSLSDFVLLEKVIALHDITLRSRPKIRSINRIHNHTPLLIAIRWSTINQCLVIRVRVLDNLGE